jgi:GNAT superfamily N-acetyltransferase
MGCADCPGAIHYLLHYLYYRAPFSNAMNQPRLVTIPAAATRPLRQVVLRPHQAAEELVFPGDDATDTRHFGAYLDEKLVGVASIYREAPPPALVMDLTPPGTTVNAWRLRGMATLPAVQGQGLGRALLEACIAYTTTQDGELLWCNARTPAVGFYLKLGFVTHGDEFEIPGIGPHYVMWRRLQA